MMLCDVCTSVPAPRAQYEMREIQSLGLVKLAELRLARSVSAPSRSFRSRACLNSLQASRVRGSWGTVLTVSSRNFLTITSPLKTKVDGPRGTPAVGPSRTLDEAAVVVGREHREDRERDRKDRKDEKTRRYVGRSRTRAPLTHALYTYWATLPRLCAHGAGLFEQPRPP